MRGKICFQCRPTGAWISRKPAYFLGKVAVERAGEFKDLG